MGVVERGSRRLVSLSGSVPPLMVMIPLLALVGWQNRHLINPDAVAYLRIGSYYVEGSSELMVSGYWAPLLSWLMVPGLLVFDDPLLAARIAMALSGAVFVLGSRAVLRALDLGPGAIVLGTWAAMLFGVSWSALRITPDLLMAGLVGLAVALVLRTSWLTDRRQQLLAGALCGGAYLAKSVALPSSILAIAALACLHLLGGHGRPKAVLRAAAVTIVACLVVAAPWVAVLSAHYGGLQITTSTGYVHGLVGPYRDPFMTTFHVPRPGRVTSWEEPTELEYGTWSPFDSPRLAVHQLVVIWQNTGAALDRLADMDMLRMGPFAALAALLFHSPWRANLGAHRWRWAAVVIGSYTVAYLPLYAEAIRYYLVAYPFLLGASLGFAGSLAARPGGGGRTLQGLAVGLVALSFIAATAWPLANTLIGRADPEGGVEARTAAMLAERLDETGLAGSLAAVAPEYGTGYVGLYTAFFLERPWHGRAGPVASPDEVRASGADLVLVPRGSAADVALAPNLETTDPILFGSEEEAARFPYRIYRSRSGSPSKSAPEASAKQSLREATAR